MSNNESPKSINEHLSALLDDETGAFEQRRVLDELKSDSDLSQKLSAYALIGETMRTGDSEKPLITVGTSFLDGIHEKIELEDDFNEVVLDTGTFANTNSDQAVQTKTRAGSTSWLRPVGGFAVAASVGALAFMGLQNMGLLSSPGAVPSGIVNSSSPTAIAQTIPNSEKVDILTTSTNPIASEKDDQYADADAQARSLLKRYVDSHMQYAASTTFVPSVRVIAYADSQ